MSSNETPLFDQNAEHYESDVNAVLAPYGTEIDFFVRGKAEHLLRQASRHFPSLDSVALLDIGCGIGLLHSHLVSHVGKLTGVDVAEKAVSEARSRIAEAEYFVYQGGRLPFDDCCFDIACTVCVMHHVDPEEWSAFAREMFRVLRPGGLALVFEHNPFNPLTRAVVSRCEFDRDARLLRASQVLRLFRESGFVDSRRQYIFFTPWQARFFGWLDRRLSWLPLGAQYCVLGRRAASGAYDEGWGEA